jgi:hypothetical protein
MRHRYGGFLDIYNCFLSFLFRRVLLRLSVERTVGKMGSYVLRFMGDCAGFAS